MERRSKNNKDKNSIRPYTDGFRHAIRGILLAFRTETNLRIHGLAAFLVVLLSYEMGLNTMEWCVIILCISMVITAEVFNTAVENLADAISLDDNPYIKNAKDIAAGGVLITAVASIIISAIVFIPKLF